MVILYNMKGFWNSTIALLDDMAEKSMIRGDWRDVIEVADNLEEYHHKMVILYNMKGFWNSTIALLDDMAEKSMIRGDWRDVIEVADNLEELSKMCI